MQRDDLHRRGPVTDLLRQRLSAAVGAAALLWLGAVGGVGCHAAVDSRSDSGDGGDVQRRRDAGDSSDDGWTRLLGTPSAEHLRDLAVDSRGNVYLAGMTRGELRPGGPHHRGGSDAFLAKYDSDGRRRWIRLLGTAGDETAWSVTAGADGAVYLAGTTTSSLAERPYHGGKKDGFLAAYEPNGRRRWVRLLGTPNKDLVNATAAGASGGLYLVGSMGPGEHDSTHRGGQDAFVAAYDATGRRRWLRLLGTAGNDWAVDLDVSDSGRIYAVGRVDEALEGTTFRGGSFDAFLAALDSDGSRRWVRLLGTSGWDDAQSIAVGGDGAVYVGGWTQRDFGGHSFGGGWSDAFLTKFDATGRRTWVRLLGGEGKDVARCVVADRSGRIYLAGHTSDALGRRSAADHSEAFVGVYTSDGELLRTRLWGGSGGELVSAIALAGGGELYLAGLVDASVDGHSYHGGSFDGFITRF